MQEKEAVLVAEANTKRETAEMEVKQREFRKRKALEERAKKLKEQSKNMAEIVALHQPARKRNRAEEAAEVGKKRKKTKGGSPERLSDNDFETFENQDKIEDDAMGEIDEEFHPQKRKKRRLRKNQPDEEDDHMNELFPDEKAADTTTQPAEVEIVGDEAEPEQENRSEKKKKKKKKKKEKREQIPTEYMEDESQWDETQVKIKEKVAEIVLENKDNLSSLTWKDIKKVIKRDLGKAAHENNKQFLRQVIGMVLQAQDLDGGGSPTEAA